MEGRIECHIAFRNEESAIESAFALTDALADNDSIVSCQIVYEAMPDSTRVCMHGYIETDEGGEVLDDIATVISVTCIPAPGFVRCRIDCGEAEAI
jgi:hypothetical protein